MDTIARGRRFLDGVPAPVIAAIAVAWTLAVAAQVSDSSSLINHDRLIEGGLPLADAVAIHLCAWAGMVIAMMLPTAMPLLRLFGSAAAGQQRPAAAATALVSGYALVWMSFGAVAFATDLGLHAAIDSSRALRSVEWTIGGGVLLVAGVFQFSSLKDACLRQCRHPAAFLLRHYQRGVGGGLRLGIRHGVLCVGCCWALMLVMFAVGMANLVCMAVLTVVMVYEKTHPQGRDGVAVTGVALIGAATIVLAYSASASGVLS